ncbi:MAG TPA: aspartate aminotransferase family protein [Salinisphaeraceae bacterium]|nr:aspartate aminotransferase family protein [Salinisphaeraceae bacterium]
MQSSTQNFSSTNELLNRRSVLGPAYRLFYDQPLELVKGDGVWVEDARGRQFLDAYNNVPVVGHCNPAVVAALTQQAATLNTHTRYLHENIVRYAERLLDLFPSGLDTAMFTCTGSEANDLALRIAGEFTGQRGLIVTENAYHGVTAAVAEISPSLAETAPHVRVIPPPSQFAGPPDAVADRFAQAVDRAADDLEAKGIGIAALMLDSVFASDGLYVESSNALATAADRIHARGGLFVVDEVQGGFARTGSHWWSFQRDDCMPDMVSMGKPMGNGHPVAGLVLQRHLLEHFGNNYRYFNTFGGNTVSAAVGLAVLDELERINAPTHVHDMGLYVSNALDRLAQQYDCIGAVRGAGLYWCIDVHDPSSDSASDARIAESIVNGMCHAGVLIGTSGIHGNSLKIRPPLVFQTEHVDRLISTLEQQCKKLRA